MSVSPAATSPHSPLCGTEGELVFVRISVEPRLVEHLLDALAQLEFPINPQLYHNAATVYLYPDGRNAVHSTTLVEFPAWDGRLPEIRKALTQAGHDPASLTVKRLLDDLDSECDAQPAPSGAPYTRVITYKHPSRSQKACA